MGRGLIVFDCDGVLTTAKSSWAVLHEYFGSRDNRLFADYYRRGIITYEDWMKIDVALMIHSYGKPIRRQDVERAVSWIGVREEAPGVVSRLMREGYVVAVVSSGIGEVVGRVCSRLGISLCYYNELRYEGDELVPGGLVRVPLMEKHRVIAELAEKSGFDLGEVTYVGDDVWDIDIFNVVGNSVAVKPCGEACSRARWVVEDLTEILPIVEKYYSSIRETR